MKTNTTYSTLKYLDNLPSPSQNFRCLLLLMMLITSCCCCCCFTPVQSVCFHTSRWHCSQVLREDSTSTWQLLLPERRSANVFILQRLYGLILLLFLEARCNGWYAERMSIPNRHGAVCLWGWPMVPASLRSLAISLKGLTLLQLYFSENTNDPMITNNSLKWPALEESSPATGRSN